jgi:hypothetical protein
MGATRCHTCGAELEVGDGFCMACGQPVVAPRGGIEPATAPVDEAAPGWPMRRLLLIAGGVLLLFVIAVLVVLLIPRRSQQLPGEELIPVDPSSNGCLSPVEAPLSLYACWPVSAGTQATNCSGAPVDPSRDARLKPAPAANPPAAPAALGGSCGSDDGAPDRVTG